MTPWWEQWPERLPEELQRLEDLGFVTNFDRAKPLSSPIVIDARYTIDGTEYSLRILFPDLYPYFRPDVQLLNADLPHHQNPLGKNICLLGRNSDNWSTNDLVGDVIARQLPTLLSSEQTAQSGGQPDEELQAEPWIEYLSPDPAFRILWNPDIQVPLGSRGHLELRYEQSPSTFYAYVDRVSTSDGYLWQESNPSIRGPTTKLTVPFFSIGHVPPANERLASLIAEALPKYNPASARKRLGKLQCALLGLFYPEEIDYRENGVGLTFVVFDNFRQGGRARTRLLRTYRAGRDYIVARLGPLGSIKHLEIALVGFGNLGSATATTLCKLGVKKITVIDRDPLDPGNTVRHTLGMQFAGQEKAEAAAALLSRSYPYTTITPVIVRLGDVGASTMTEAVTETIETSDVIVDCSAERAVQHFLSTEAWTRNKPYLFAEGYPGMLGGYVGLIRPGTDPCFLCFLAALEDGSIPRPPTLANGTVQPFGCGEPTFVGTPFDGDTISAAAVRLLYSRLSEESHYPRAMSPYYRIDLASNDCEVSQVSVDPVNVQQRPGCAVCGSH